MWVCAVVGECVAIDERVEVVVPPLPVPLKCRCANDGAAALFEFAPPIAPCPSWFELIDPPCAWLGGAMCERDGLAFVEGAA